MINAKYIINMFKELIKTYAQVNESKSIFGTQIFYVINDNQLEMIEKELLKDN